MVKTFKTFLTEGREAPIYHATSVSSAQGILFLNSLNSNGNSQPLHPKPHKDREGFDLTSAHAWKAVSGISFSRNYRYTVNYAFHEKSFHTVVVFEVDQRKLTMDYKIVPANFWKIGHNAHKNQINPIADPHPAVGTREDEEFVVARSIRNFDKYILKIHVCSKLTEAMIFGSTDPRDWKIGATSDGIPILKNHPKLYDSTNARETGGFYIDKL